MFAKGFHGRTQLHRSLRLMLDMCIVWWLQHSWCSFANRILYSLLYFFHLLKLIMIIFLYLFFVGWVFWYCSSVAAMHCWSVVLQFGGKRAKLETADGNFIDSMFIDRRDSGSMEGQILVRSRTLPKPLWLAHTIGTPSTPLMLHPYHWCSSHTISDASSISPMLHPYHRCFIHITDAPSISLMLRPHYHWCSAHTVTALLQ